MVVDRQVVIAQALGSLRVILDGLDVVTELYLWKHDTVPHGASSLVVTRCLFSDSRSVADILPGCASRAQVVTRQKSRY